MAPPRLPIADRLLSRIEVTAGECWFYTGTRDKDGYGQIGIGRGRQYRAHRVAYETFVGPISRGAFVCHACDNPPCINPSHLFLGSARENALDMWQKQRKEPLRGVHHPMAKLSDEQVADIRRLRADGHTLTRIANLYGISFQHVSLLYRRLSR